MIHRFLFSVAYADTDAGGIVYHGRYIEIAERARMDMLRGVAQPDVQRGGFVVRELNVRYLAPLYLADDFVVESRVVETGAAFMKIEQKFVKDDIICAIINLKVVYVGANMRPVRIPDAILAQLTVQNN